MWRLQRCLGAHTADPTSYCVAPSLELGLITAYFLTQGHGAGLLSPVSSWPSLALEFPGDDLGSDKKVAPDGRTEPHLGASGVMLWGF